MVIYILDSNLIMDDGKKIYMIIENKNCNIIYTWWLFMRYNDCL